MKTEASWPACAGSGEPRAPPPIGTSPHPEPSRLDGDPDLEPSLADTTTDLEMDDADLEPSLGWTVSGALGSCASWLSVDLEDDPADGPEFDPSEFECWDVPLHLDTAPLP